MRVWLQNLRSGAALALGRRQPLRSFRVSSDQIAAFACLHVASAVLAGFVAVAPPRSFSFAALAGQALLFAVILCLAWASGKETRTALTGDRTAATALVLLAGLWPLWLGYIAIGFSTARTTPELAAALPWVYWLFATPWLLCVGVRALETGSRLRGARAFAMAASAFIVAAGLVNTVETKSFWSARLDVAQPSAAATDARIVNAEDTLFAQRELLDASIGTLEPERPGTTDLYYLAFAADATQGVFRREVEQSVPIVEAALGTQGRSLMLVSDVDTVAARPIASGTNLRASLRAVARRMNVEEDVLFLFLTGHGSRTHEIAVRFPPLPLNRFGPEELAAWLAEAGIRWRVVVVSACYSGGFVEPLANDATLVITASAADRTSFGCSNEAEWTWFGRAFFAEALQPGRSIEDAFELARKAVEAREQGESKEPSMPQIFVGDAIRAKLEQRRAHSAAIVASRQRSGE